MELSQVYVVRGRITKKICEDYTALKSLEAAVALEWYLEILKKTIKQEIKNRE